MPRPGPAETFDFIVIGAGSAGCVVANRLSADRGASVLLLEAGGRDRDPFIHIPIGIGKLWQERLHDWGYSTEPQAHLDGRRIELPRGKVLGGCSSINALMYVRGDRGDYERWAHAGASGWSYAEVLPYFKRAEAWCGGGDAYRGGSGPLGTQWADLEDPIVQAVLESARRAGYPLTEDINGAQAEGFARTQATIARGRRASTANAYLRPALARNNLTVRPASLATRIMIEKGRATGVEYVRGAQSARAFAAREVILSGGAINSPQVLMLSGIGDPAQLRRHSIAVACDLPGVGANLQDHLAFVVAFERKESGPLARALRYDALALAMLRAYWFGTGVASNVPGGVMALLRSHPALEVPDVQLLFRGLPREAKPWWPGSAPSWQDSFAYPVVLLHPRSRGTVQLASPDPARALRIDANYLSAEIDFDPLLAGIRIAREVTRQAPLARFAGAEISPGAGAASERDLKASIRKGAASIHHACGTCRMGSDEGAVVDTELRVRGVERLRVVDASVMPDVIGGNINACVIMVAEKASDLIRGAGAAAP